MFQSIKNLMKKVEEYGIIQLRKPQEYYGYDMFFLKTPVIIMLNDPVKLNQNQYNFSIQMMSDHDASKLNNTFQMFVTGLDINPMKCFINVKTAKFTNLKTGRIILFKDAHSWDVKILVQGYKLGNNMVLQPIWQIEEAKCL